MSNGNFEYLVPVVMVDNSGTDVTYTVSGNGVIVVTAAYYSNTNDSSGYWRAIVYQNDVRIYADADQFGTNTSNNYGSSVCVPIEVKDQDTIRVYLINTKSGTKYVYKRFLLFGGCTLIKP